MSIVRSNFDQQNQLQDMIDEMPNRPRVPHLKVQPKRSFNTSPKVTGPRGLADPLLTKINYRGGGTREVWQGAKRV